MAEQSEVRSPESATTEIKVEYFDVALGGIFAAPGHHDLGRFWEACLDQHPWLRKFDCYIWRGHVWYLKVPDESGEYAYLWENVSIGTPGALPFTEATI